ncbi:MAG: DUF29 domain-containing protein [Geminicoccaceae bacterium]|nr:DUF29 domain-containing protein [Geminicoccaceae bacterium]
MSDMASLYDEDFYVWTQLQARELRRLKSHQSNLPLDLDHLAEEIRDLGKEQRNGLRSWCSRIIEHLLLLEHSPAREPRRGWIREIAGFRREIRRRITPALKRDLRGRRQRLYLEAKLAVEQRAALYDEPVPDLPEACPYALDQLLDDWWPEGLRA